MSFSSNIKDEILQKTYDDKKYDEVEKFGELLTQSALKSDLKMKGVYFNGIGYQI